MVSEEPAAPSMSPTSAVTCQDAGVDLSISELRKKHELDLENLTLITQPFRTLKLFALAILQYLRRSVFYVFNRGGWSLHFCAIVAVLGLLLLVVDGRHEKHAHELVSYLNFTVWWVALGVASSIGLGSGLHTFVIYLGPHIAFFTRKAMQCGRVDLKASPYDTIQLNRGPSWSEKDCIDYGPPVFPSLPNSLVRVPFSSILPQVQLEAVLWGVGTALGELPPYFISRAAFISGGKLDGVEKLESSSKEGLVAGFLTQIKCLLLSHLNFFTILLLASVPNPLFDLAGIVCGQLGIPFWQFFLATLMGKAIIKTHIQTLFIISTFNNQLLEWMENGLPILGLRFPNLVTKLLKVKETYLQAPDTLPSNSKAKVWDHLSIALLWNTFVWLMLLSFFVKIVTATAHRYLRKQQEAELAAIVKQRAVLTSDPAVPGNDREPERFSRAAFCGLK